MAVRLEWTEAEYAGTRVVDRGTRLADGNTVSKQLAIVIGPLVMAAAPSWRRSCDGCSRSSAREKVMRDAARESKR